MNRKALGQGIKALIPDFETGVAENAAPARSMELLIDEIVPNPQQPRKFFDDSKLAELVESIRENGVIQPVVAQKIGDGYELIVGERRWRAAKKAGLKKIPVLLREAAGQDSLALAIIENIHRQDLNPMEEAEAYQRLAEEFGLTQQEVAARVGKNRATVANFLRLLKLPGKVKEDLAGERLSMGHARALLGLSTDQAILKARNEILKKDLNVRQTESLVKRLSATKKPGAKSKVAQKDIFIRKLESELERSLGSKVQVQSGKKGGKVVISYYSEDDLERIRVMITRRS